MSDKRSLKKLWKLVYKYGKTNGYQLGICQNLLRMLDDELINGFELKRLHASLYDNQPLRSWLRGLYWWDSGESKPRQKFIKHLIKKLEAENEIKKS